jgi:hypothetical protein
MRAQGFGRAAAAARIAKALWDKPVNFQTPAFTTGAQVLWKPIPALRKLPAGWLAVRQPPPEKNEDLKRAQEPRLQPRALSSMLREAYDLWKSEQGPSSKKILWDLRFSIEFFLDKMSEQEVKRFLSSSGELVVGLGRGVAYPPRIVYKSGDKEDEVVHEHILDVSEVEGGSLECVLEGKQSEWIEIRYARPLAGI